MQKGRLDLDNVMRMVEWPEPSRGLKGRILDACDETTPSKRASLKRFNRAAIFSVLITIGFISGALTGSYNSVDDGSDSYVYAGTGTVLASELFK